MRKAIRGLAGVMAALALLFIGQSAAQDSTGFRIIFGDRRGLPTPIRIGSLLEIPVWGVTPRGNYQDSVTFMHIPLASNDSFIAARRGGYFADTLVGRWDDRSFRPAEPDSVPDWTNQSILAITNLYDPLHPQDYFWTNGDTVLIGTFRMLMSADSSLAGDTISPFREGYDQRDGGLLWGLQDGITSVIPVAAYPQLFFSSWEYPWMYILGDINENGIVNGNDVVYAVNYFRGGPPPPHVWDCPWHGNLCLAGDVNGTCTFNGIDITYLVSYFKGGPELHPCPD
jgi:hypothetical protein